MEARLLRAAFLAGAYHYRTLSRWFPVLATREP
jgi:hypothetical protein